MAPSTEWQYREQQLAPSVRKFRISRFVEPSNSTSNTASTSARSSPKSPAECRSRELLSSSTAEGSSDLIVATISDSTSRSAIANRSTPVTLGRGSNANRMRDMRASVPSEPIIKSTGLLLLRYSSSAYPEEFFVVLGNFAAIESRSLSTSGRACASSRDRTVRSRVGELAARSTQPVSPSAVTSSIACTHFLTLPYFTLRGPAAFVETIPANVQKSPLEGLGGSLNPR